MKFTEREFWATLIPAVIGLLVAIGVIGPDDNALMQAITTLGLIAGPSIAYIIMRVWQKVEIVKTNANAKVEEAKAQAQAPPTN